MIIEDVLLRIFELLICVIIFMTIRRVKRLELLSLDRDLALKEEKKIRETQDWKLYNYIKANFNTIVGRKRQ